MALLGLGRDISGGDVEDDVAGEGVAADVADESDVRSAVRGVEGRDVGREMQLKVVAQNRAIYTAALVAIAVSADEHDRGGHGLGCEEGGRFGGTRWS